MLFPIAPKIALLSTIAIAATITTRIQDHVHTRIQLPKITPPGLAPGFVIKYVNPQDCHSTSPTQQYPRPVSYIADKCYNLNYPWDIDPQNPEIMKWIKITSPAICEDGRKAQFATFAAPFCLLPHDTMLTDSIMGKCLDVHQVFSFGFVCDGIPEILGKEVLQTIIISIIAFGVVIGAALLLLCCGGTAVVGTILGLFVWTLWSIVRFLIGSIVRFIKVG